MSRFVRDTQFASLSIKDLLEARDHYHVHLANLDNVIGTAVGLYRILDSDPDKDDPHTRRKIASRKPRTLSNSVVRPWSWPCVLVFVREWQDPTDFHHKPSQIVPPTLYLPDGRVVPTCVVHAPTDEIGPGPAPQLSFPPHLYGGGFPILTDGQGQTRVGSVGCLVTDGSYVYALTNSHVVAEPGTKAYTIARGRRLEIASSTRKSARCIPLEELYPGWKGVRTKVNVDAGLFEVDDMSDWTAQVYGVGELGEPIDLSVDTMNLSLIGCPVLAHGGASGELTGEVQGMFYRYRSVGGVDYVAELLIGPRQGEGPVATRPGDSGTLWCWDAEHDGAAVTKEQPAKSAGRANRIQPRPLALQWGGRAFLDPGRPGTIQFALASCLSTVCKVLDVEVVRDWAIGHSLYWGKTGHYKVAGTACGLASKPKLSKLLAANLEVIAVSDPDIEAGRLPSGGAAQFVALADVADLVWRNTRKKDEANHFADMDQPGGSDGAGATLMQLWKSNLSSRTPAFWTQFYDDLPEPPEDKHRGALPFRVKQMYDLMVEAVSKGDAREFIALAGTMAHYVGDACQPLHVSMFHHGRPGHPEDSAVHGDYETKMLDRFAPDLVEKVNGAVGSRRVTSTIKGGMQAADAVVQLMEQTIARLDPEKLVEKWIETKGNNHISDLWDAVGDDTAACIAEGALTLAMLWQSAWVEGKGDQTVAADSLDQQVSKSWLRARYGKAAFAPSDWLRNM
jgi:hypothetical protein